MTLKLTAEGFRAARALLDWTVRDLMREAQVSPNTVSAVESGRGVGEKTEAKIIEAFARHGVEIFDGESPGARVHLRKAKQESGHAVRNARGLRELRPRRRRWLGVKAKA